VKATTLAAGIGKGVLAGLAGTAAMTVSSTVEAKLRGRPFSTAPARAAAKVLGIEFEDARAQARFSDLVHWGYGTAWGVGLGLMRALGLSPRFVAPAHFAALWGSEVVMLPALEVAPPVPFWEAEDIAIDLFHHLVYVGATAAAFEWLTRSASAAQA
jgi:hypothetical protein